MSRRDSHIAILYFSRTAKAESRVKHWLNADASGNLALSKSLTSSADAVLHDTGLPIYHYHEGIQRGKTFGERLANAFEEIFQLGYRGVIAVGNDSPELGTTDFDQVANQLLEGNCVLGPSLRGGAYLIGLTKHAFDKTGFESLPWQSANLFAALTEQLIATDFTVKRLKYLRDVNSLHDFLALVKSDLLAVSFKRYLRNIIKKPLSIVLDIEKIAVGFTPLSHALRGPPALI